jgi:hypothetical protein
MTMTRVIQGAECQEIKDKVSKKWWVPSGNHAFTDLKRS